eukprot:g11659.t1
MHSGRHSLNKHDKDYFLDFRKFIKKEAKSALKKGRPGSHPSLVQSAERLSHQFMPPKKKQKTSRVPSSFSSSTTTVPIPAQSLDDNDPPVLPTSSSTSSPQASQDPHAELVDCARWKGMTRWNVHIVTVLTLQQQSLFVSGLDCPSNPLFPILVEELISSLQSSERRRDPVSLNVPTSSCHMLTSCQQTGRLVRQAPTLLSIPLFAATDDNEIQSKSMRRPLKEGEMAPCAFSHAVGDSALSLPRGRDRTSHASYSEKR